MKDILLHGGADEAFDRSVVLARRLAETFGARLHVVYTVEDPLSAGWTAEMSADRLPELHQAIEEEARERLARLIPLDDQERLGIDIAIRIGAAADELVRYTMERNISLAIVASGRYRATGGEAVRALLDRGKCAVLVLR